MAMQLDVRFSPGQRAWAVDRTRNSVARVTVMSVTTLVTSVVPITPHISPYSSPFSFPNILPSTTESTTGTPGTTWTPTTVCPSTTDSPSTTDPDTSHTPDPEIPYVDTSVLVIRTTYTVKLSVNGQEIITTVRDEDMYELQVDAMQALIDGP